MELPKTYDFGSGELVELKHLETTFSIGPHTAVKYLNALRIKPLYIGDGVFFSLPTFNRIMYVLGRPGSPGFVFPKSKARDHFSRRLKKQGFLVQVTDEILKEANSPRILAEMIAAGGQDTSVLKKLITHPPQKVGEK